MLSLAVELFQDDTRVLDSCQLFQGVSNDDPLNEIEEFEVLTHLEGY